MANAMRGQVGVSLISPRNYQKSLSELLDILAVFRVRMLVGLEGEPCMPKSFDGEQS